MIDDNLVAQGALDIDLPTTSSTRANEANVDIQTSRQSSTTAQPVVEIFPDIILVTLVPLIRIVAAALALCSAAKWAILKAASSVHERLPTGEKIQDWTAVTSLRQGSRMSLRQGSRKKGK